MPVPSEYCCEMHSLKNLILPISIIGISLACTASLHALRDEDNQGRWEKPCEVGPDALVPGFLVNMGPTGARGILKEQSYVVKFIFDDSPADGVLQLDDEVYGANGKQFAKHQFGRKVNGIEGPMQHLGLAIEDSESSDGALSLMIRRGGESQVVDVQLEKLGRFADSFPHNCEKTRLLLDRAYRYLIDNPGGLDSQGRAAAALALLSSDDPEVFAAGRQMALDWNKPYGNDTWTWHLAFQSLTLAEYYLRSGDAQEWQAQTRHGFSQKSGLAHLIYQLSPERPNADTMMQRHAGNISEAYRDMSDGHACALMGLTWGWVGVAASENLSLKREVLDYYKAWINMARCHGSDSYVILPARDYADYSYYRKNIRNHTTAAVALLYSFTSPNLRLQGASETIEHRWPPRSKRELLFYWTVRRMNGPLKNAFR